MKTKTEIAENRTIFDGRPIRETDLKITESGEYALYASKRVDTETDEVHIFPMEDDAQICERMLTIFRQMTGDPEIPVSEISFQTETDDRLILSVQKSPCVGEYDAGRKTVNYLQSRI